MLLPWRPRFRTVLFEISDRISVLHDGEFVGCVHTAQCSQDMLIRSLVEKRLAQPCSVWVYQVFSLIK